MRSAVYFIYAALFIMIVFGIYQAYLYATDSQYRISSADAKQRIKSNQIDVILDVRTDIERTTLGSYPGSIHIQSADLERRMPKLVPNKQTRILAYCNTGHRARMATDKLHALGYDNVVYISSTYTTLL
jgi:rhodanese-related sulfurtransferase